MMKKSNRTIHFLCAALCAVYVCARPASAQETSDAGSADAPLDLSLADAVARALENNPELKAAQLDWRMAREMILGAYSPFEPSLVQRYNKGELQRQNDLGEQISRGGELYRERTKSVSAGVEGELPGGAKYRFGTSMEEKADDLSSTYAGLGRLMSASRRRELERPEHILKANAIGSFIPEYNSFIGVSVTQPILKGSLNGSSIAAVRTANADEAAAFHTYRKQLMTALLKTEAAYWNLVYAQERYKADGDSVRIAMKLVEDAREREKAGKMSQLDRVQAEAGLATRCSEQADSYQALLDAMIRMKLLLADVDISRYRQVRATDPLVVPGIDRAALGTSMMAAFEWACDAQPDYLVRRANLARDNVRLSYFRNQRLPQLDLTGSWGLTGWGLEMEDAWDSVKDGGNTDWSVGAELRLPLWTGLKERSEAQSALFRRNQSRQSLIGVENELVASLASVERQLSSFADQAADSEKVVSYTRQVLDAEISRLDVGKNTMRQVYDAEEDLALAARKRLETLVKYREAMLSLAFVSGTVLRDKGLERLDKGRLILSERVDPSGWSKSVTPISRLPQLSWERQRSREMRERGITRIASESAQVMNTAPPPPQAVATPEPAPVPVVEATPSVEQPASKPETQPEAVKPEQKKAGEEKKPEKKKPAKEKRSKKKPTAETESARPAEPAPKPAAVEEEPTEVTIVVTSYVPAEEQPVPVAPETNSPAAPPEEPVVDPAPPSTVPEQPEAPAAEPTPPVAVPEEPAATEPSQQPMQDQPEVEQSAPAASAEPTVSASEPVPEDVPAPGVSEQPAVVDQQVAPVAEPPHAEPVVEPPVSEPVAISVETPVAEATPADQPAAIVPVIEAPAEQPVEPADAATVTESSPVLAAPDEPVTSEPQVITMPNEAESPAVQADEPFTEPPPALIVEQLENEEPVVQVEVEPEAPQAVSEPAEEVAVEPGAEPYSTDSTSLAIAISAALGLPVPESSASTETQDVESVTEALMTTGVIMTVTEPSAAESTESPAENE